MKKTISSLVLFVMAMMLSGCIFPYWVDDGYSGGHYGGHDNGRHRGGGGRH